MTDSPNASLPPVIDQFVAAINTGDVDLFVKSFHTDGFVDDWGTKYNGTDGVRSWAHSDAIGMNAHMTVLTAEREGDTVTTTFAWKSNKFNGESTGIFELAGDEIVSFTIPPHR